MFSLFLHVSLLGPQVGQEINFSFTVERSETLILLLFDFFAFESLPLPSQAILAVSLCVIVI